MNEIAKQLQAPFAADDYEWRVQSESFKGTVNVLCYVTARAIQNRLDEVFGPFGWSTKYSVGPGGGVICELSCKEQGKGEWVSKQDGAENTDIEAVKGGISGAIKRAGSAWGIGRLLYNLPSSWVDLKSQGKHYHKLKKPKGDVRYMYWDEPRLPDWAVAGENKKPSAKKTEPKKKPTTKKPSPEKTDLPDCRERFIGILTETCKKQKVDPPSDSIKKEFLQVLCEEPANNIIAEKYKLKVAEPGMFLTSTGWTVLSQMITDKGFNMEIAIQAACNRAAERQNDS